MAMVVRSQVKGARPCVAKTEFVYDFRIPHWKEFFVVIFATIAPGFIIFPLILCCYNLFTVLSYSFSS